MNLPEDIKSSVVLTQSDLEKLASVSVMPNETDVNDYKLIELSEYFMDLEDDQAKLELTLHDLAKKLLSEDKLEEAWMCLLAFNNG